MSSVAVPSPHVPMRRRRSGVFLVILASAVAIGVFILLHKDVPLPYATFRGACQRLRASGLPITDKDWFCHAIPWTKHACFVVASLLAAAAFALPCAILAAAGRRFAALLPLVVLPLVTYPTLIYAYDLRWWQGTWPVGGVANAAITLALVLAPAAVLAVTGQRPTASRAPISLAGAGLASVGCLIALIPVRYLTDALFARHFEAMGVTLGSVSLLWPAVAMALFGAVLGTDRRWWPWVLAPAAFLISFAPATASLVGPEGIQDWSLFGGVLPLFLVGLIASAWKPLATRVTRGLAHDGGPSDGRVAAGPSRRRRSTIVLNASAAALLIVSLIAFVADPLPAQVASSLPTYLGLRGVVGDVRTRMNLRLAIQAMDRYRAEVGTYRGFDTEAATTIEPRLAWTGRASHATEPLWMWIATTHTRVARVVGVSPGGSAICIERTSEGLTYGSASGRFGSGATNRLLHRALRACGAMPWSSSVLQVPPFIATMCDGLDRSGGYLICRMVQSLNVTTLSRTKPDGV
jgi:hypothetical protein